MKPSAELTAMLEALEAAIDPATEDALIAQWLDFSHGKTSRSELFSPRRDKAITIEAFPHILINHAMEDYNLMARREFESCVHTLRSGGGAVMNTRSNYSTSTVMSLFDVEMFYLDDRNDTLPTSYALKDWKTTAKAALEGGIDINRNLCRKVFEMGEFFREVMKPYPKVAKYIGVYHPDFQGPFDIAEVLIGSGIFYELYDEPDLLKDFLDLLTTTYIRLMNHWESIYPYNGTWSKHWGFVHLGNLMLRDDSAMNLSPALFEEFVAPYDMRLLAELGGGAVHFCGRGDHYIKYLTENYPQLYAINMSQPHLNDMNVIMENTIDKDIKLVAFSRDAALQFAGRENIGCINV